MERQKTTTELKHNDAFSSALINATVNYLGEEGIPTPANNPFSNVKNPDDFSQKTTKEKATAPEMTKSKYSLGAEIKDTTKVVTKESCGSEHDKEEKSEKSEKKCKSCKKSPCECDMKEEVIHEEIVGTTYEFELDGVKYFFEKKNAEGKEQGADGKACWKGYKYAGTEGGKDKCVKAGYEMDGEQELDEKAPPGAKYERMVKHIKKGYSEGGVSEKEKSIAYATAWKEKNKKKATKEEFEITEKKLDPVGKEDKDIDNDGDHDKSDKYLHARRNKIGKILAANKKIKEETDLIEKK